MAKTQKKRILTIEDNPTDQRFIQKVLEKEGYVVLTASSGEEGLQIAKEKKPDMIILDEILPGIHGVEIGKRLRQDPQTKNIPFLFLTIVDSPKVVLEHFELDAINHLINHFFKKRRIGNLF